MKEVEIIGLLNRQGLVLFLDDGRLRCRGQLEAYTPELRQMVDQHRAVLVDHLKAHEAALADLISLAEKLAGDPWVTPAHRAILGDWQAAARKAAEAGRDPREFVVGLHAWADRWRHESKGQAASPLAQK